MASHFQRSRDERLIIGITGHIGSGKTSIGNYLSSTHGFQYVRYGQVLSEWLGADAEGKANLQKIGWEVMAGGMQRELNRRLIEKIEPDADVAVDGLRHPLDYESLHTLFSSSFHLLYIESALGTRWKRLKGRGRYESFEMFETADSHPVEQQIEMLRPNADLVLENEGSIEDLYMSVDLAIRNLAWKGQG